MEAQEEGERREITGGRSLSINESRMKIRRNIKSEEEEEEASTERTE